MSTSSVAPPFNQNAPLLPQAEATRFVEAAKLNDLQSLKALHTQYGDVILNAYDNIGYTALCAAAGYAPAPTCFHYLLEAGADINKPTAKGMTPLIAAAQYSNWPRLILLLERGAEANAQDINGWTALLMASCRNTREAITELLDYNANPNAQNNEGLSPLMFAASNRDEGVCRLLLAYGANASLTNQSQQTAADIALDAGMDSLAALLREAQILQDTNVIRAGLAIPTVVTPNLPLILQRPRRS